MLGCHLVNHLPHPNGLRYSRRISCFQAELRTTRERQPRFHSDREDDDEDLEVVLEGFTEFGDNEYM